MRPAETVCPEEQDAAFGHAEIASKSLLVCGLNTLAAAVSTPLSAYCDGAFVAARRRANARFSVTAWTDPKVTRGHLIVRRVKCLNPKAAGQRRGHAAVDQVVTDLINGPLNHLPSSAFEATVAWPQSAATAQPPT